MQEADRRTSLTRPTLGRDSSSMRAKRLELQHSRNWAGHLDHRPGRWVRPTRRVALTGFEIAPNTKTRHVGGAAFTSRARGQYVGSVHRPDVHGWVEDRRDRRLLSGDSGARQGTAQRVTKGTRSVMTGAAVAPFRRRANAAKAGYCPLGGQRGDIHSCDGQGDWPGYNGHGRSRDGGPDTMTTACERWRFPRRSAAGATQLERCVAESSAALPPPRLCRYPRGREVPGPPAATGDPYVRLRRPVTPDNDEPARTAFGSSPTADLSRLGGHRANHGTTR